MGKNVVDVLSKDPGSKLGMEMTGFEELEPRRVLQGSYDPWKEPSGAIDSFKGEDKQLPIDYAANPIGTAMGNDAMEIGRMGGRIMAGYGAGVGLNAAAAGGGSGAIGEGVPVGNDVAGAGSAASSSSNAASSAGNAASSGLRSAGTEQVLGETGSLGSGAAEQLGIQQSATSAGQGLNVTPQAARGFDSGINLPYANASGGDVTVGQNAAQQLGIPSTGQGATGQQVSSVGSGARGAAPTGPSMQGGGGSFVNSVLQQMKANAVPLGIMGASLYAANQRPQMPTQQQMQGLSDEARQTAQQLLTQYRSGTLSAGQAAGLEQLTRQTKNQITQYFASIGQADSTAHQQALAQVDAQSFAMKQQMLDTMLQQGMQALGVAAGPLNNIAQYQMGQDQALRQAFGNFATAAGLMYGRNAGTPSAPQPQAPQQPSQVSSMRAPVIPESQNLG